MEQKTFRVYDIAWDAPNRLRKHLPEEMTVTVTEDDVEDLNDDNDVEDYICDYISDETGYCHDGFNFEEISNQ